MKKNKFIQFMIISLFILILCGCELIYPSEKGRIILIGVALDYLDESGLSDTDNGLENPPNDLRELAYTLSSLSNRSNREFLYIPFLQQYSIDIPISNYPNKANINLVLDQLKNKENISAKVYDGNFDDSYSLTSQYNSFGNLKNVSPINKTDIVIFYFSGHGEDSNGSLRLPKEYDEQDRESYSLDLLNEKLTLLDSNVLVILDSCFSGNMIYESNITMNKATTNYLNRLSTLYNNFFNYEKQNKNNNLIVITSTLSDKLSYPTLDLQTQHKNSLFTYYLLKSLGYTFESGIGNVTDVVPTVQNSHIYLDTVYDYILSNISRQNPIIIGDRINLVLFSF